MYLVSFFVVVFLLVEVVAFFYLRARFAQLEAAAAALDRLHHDSLRRSESAESLFLEATLLYEEATAMHNSASLEMNSLTPKSFISVN